MVDLENKSTEFLDLYSKANPLPGARAKVPLLQLDDETLLTESLVLTEFIAEEFGSASFKSYSAVEMASARLFTELCGSSFSYFPILKAREDTTSFKESVRKFRDGLVAADTFLKHKKVGEGPFLLKGFSLAECNLAPFVQRACGVLPALTAPNDGEGSVDPLAICDELKLTYLGPWIRAILSHPSVVATGVNQDILVERTKQMLEKLSKIEKTAA